MFRLLSVFTLFIFLSTQVLAADKKLAVDKISPPQKNAKKYRTTAKSKTKTPKRGLASSEGALIGAQMNSTVGVLLDDFPTAMKSRMRDLYLTKSKDFWEARARQQVEATLYRLVYRNLYYSKKGQLPLPPPSQWKFQIGQAKVQTIDEHELVTVDYTFDSTLLTFPDSAVAADLALAAVGGSATETYVLPADPFHLFERTGYACMDEEDFPPNSVDSENAVSFYDDSCKAGSNNYCHVTEPAPSDSCVSSLKKYVGRIGASVVFTRLAWDSTLAAAIRLGQANPGGADLEVQMKGLENNRIIYRYIAPNSCSIAEGCVGGPGWRRLLQFDGSVANRGSLPAHLGEVEDDSLLVQHNMFEFSACHGHRHFSHYGTFTFGSGAQIGSKRAFCMESTQRYSNNESTPLTHPYSCHYQGIEAGWGDDYIAGIECQWVDITNVNTSKNAVTDALKFHSNPDQFICEGVPALDANGDFTFVSTSFVTEDGKPVDRINCNFAPNWNVNNIQSLNVTVPKEGGYINAPCDQNKNGVARNCGFARQGSLVTCTPGQTVNISCSIKGGAQPQVVRFCDTSKVLGVGIPCTYRDTFANVAVSSGSAQTVSFTCPSAKDSMEPGGKYSTYVAPVHTGDSIAAVTCK